MQRIKNKNTSVHHDNVGARAQSSGHYVSVLRVGIGVHTPLWNILTSFTDIVCCTERLVNERPGVDITWAGTEDRVKKDHEDHGEDDGGKRHSQID